MNSSKVAKLIDQQDWLEPAETALETVADSVLEPAGQPARNFLHGTWLGHPLHPAITDVPVGAWTCAAALDAYETMTGDTKYSAGADACVELLARARDDRPHAGGPDRGGTRAVPRGELEPSMPCSTSPRPVFISAHGCNDATAMTTTSARAR